MRKILVVEDNIAINEILTSSLRNEGYEVHSALNAFEGLDIFNSVHIDCIITDLVLPIMSGESFIEKIRRKSNVHILIISAKISIEEKLNGLRIGADDYFPKPFNESEVLIKISNYFKKIDQQKTSITIDNTLFIFENMNNTIIINNQELSLTSIEYFIIELLVSNLNRVVSRADFVDYLYKNEKNVFERIVDSHIKNVRKKVASITSQEFIRTVYGLGYTIRGVSNE